MKPHAAERTFELRHERSANGILAFMTNIVELVINRILSKIGHDLVDILAVECLGEIDHQLLQIGSRGSCIRHVFMVRQTGQSGQPIAHAYPPLTRWGPRHNIRASNSLRSD